MTTRAKIVYAALLAIVVVLAAFAATRTRAPGVEGIDVDTPLRAGDARGSRVQLADTDAVAAPPVEVEPARTVAAPAPDRARGARTKPVRDETPARIRVPLRVSVVDESGAPIADASVRARITRSPPAFTTTSRATSDRQGIAVLEAEGCVEAKLVVRPAEDDRAHDRVEDVVVSCFGLAVVALPTRHWLCIEAVDGEGAPVTAIERVHVRAPSHPATPREVAPKSSTGASACESPAGAYEIEVGVEAGVVRLESSRWGAAEHAYDPSAPSTMRGRLVFRRAAALRVRTLRDGAPASGVRVALGTAHPRDCGRIEQVLQGRFGWSGDHYDASQTSDADGWAEFAIDREGAFVVLAESLEFGTATTDVAFERLGRVVETAVDLDDGCALDMITIDARRAPVPGAIVDLFGPGGTRRVATADDAGRCRANAMPRGSWTILGIPPGRYGRSIAEGIVVEVDHGRTERIEVPTEPRARLAVAAASREVELYADGCPPIRIAEEHAERGVVHFASDHLGRHHVVVREKRDVRIVEVDLSEGGNELRVDAAERDARVEVEVGTGFTGTNHWLRSTTRAGDTQYSALRKGTRTQDHRAKRVFVWDAEVPAGRGELVYLDPRSGAPTIVAGDLSFVSGETRRVVVEGHGK